MGVNSNGKEEKGESRQEEPQKETLDTKRLGEKSEVFLRSFLFMVR